MVGAFSRPNGVEAYRKMIIFRYREYIIYYEKVQYVRNERTGYHIGNMGKRKCSQAKPRGMPVIREGSAGSRNTRSILPSPEDRTTGRIRGIPETPIYKGIT